MARVSFLAAKLVLTLDLNERATRNEVFPNRLITVLKDLKKKTFLIENLMYKFERGQKTYKVLIYIALEN